ncbi:uncharacterized protein LOC135132992 [Zophobas morio]|uniref:uncharacterized protein LOC135132992 n=1 Tax=Zophobas morio TaxID=2755281 RepID=UPI003082B52D
MVTIRKGDKDKTAFVTFFGLYPFLRMSFGMRNFLTTLQQLIDRFKAGLPDVYIAYMYERFHPVERKQAEVRIRLLPNKVPRPHFANGEISPHPVKISAIIQLAPPVDVNQPMLFLQTCSWFSWFIPGFSGVAEPLTRLTKRKAQRMPVLTQMVHACCGRKTAPERNYTTMDRKA